MAISGHKRLATLQRYVKPSQALMAGANQARVLLAALAAGQDDTYAGLRAQPSLADAEVALKQTGLIYSSTGPHQVHVSDDVRFSLRYCGASDLCAPSRARP